MSLIAWLPLLYGDLNDKCGRTMDTTFGVEAPTSVANGKIGKGYTFSSHGIRIKNIPVTKTMSFALWIKLTSNSACHILDLRGHDNGTETGYQPIYYDGSGVQIYSSAGSNSAYNPCSLGTSWHHLVVTIEDGHGRLYLDGVYKNENTSLVGCVDTCHLTLGCRCSGANKMPGIIQDVRIYNHVLTKKEVKELSRALVFHCTFDGGMGEETTNLLPISLQNKYVENVADAASYTITSGLGANSYTLFANIKCGVNDNSPTPYFSLFADYADGTTEPLTTSTSLDGTSLTTAKDDQFHPYQLTIENPQRKTVTKLYGWLLDRGSYGGQARYMTVQNAQLEAKDHATAFTSSTRAGQPKNNTGLIHGTMENQGVVFCKDIQRRSVGYFKNGGQQLIYTGLSEYESALTTSMWFKSSNKSPLDGYHILFSIDDGSVEISIPANGQLRYGGYPSSGSRVCENYSVKVGGQNVNLLDGKWHLINTVFDGTGWLSYVDGEYQTKWTMTSNVRRLSGTLRIGKYTSAATYGATDAYMDDVRLYNTVLSEDDIKQLYESSWAANRQGQVFSNTLNENQSKFQITKGGVNNCSEIIEHPNLPSGYIALDKIWLGPGDRIATYYTPNQNTGIDIEFELTDTTNDKIYVFGAGGANYTDRTFELYPYSGDFDCNFGNNSVNIGTLVLNKKIRFIRQQNKVTMYINGAKYTAENTMNNFTCPNTLYLGILNRNSTALSKVTFPIYRCVITESGQLIRYYIPCINSSGQRGMYELVTKQFTVLSSANSVPLQSTVQTHCSGTIYCNEFNEI